MNFAAFDLNLLRVFDALMRERSVTRAGALIGLSQPAVSNALGRLRHALNDELFVRRGNDMVPTPRAEALAERVREALAELEQALYGDTRFDPSHADRIFTLMGADFFATLLMPDLAERIAQLAPRIALRMVDSASGEVERLLRENVIDVALESPSDVPEWISQQPLFRSPFAIIAAHNHEELRKAGVKPGAVIPLDLYCSLPHALRSIDGSMSGLLDEALHKVGAARRVMLTLPNFQGIARAVARGRLIAAVPVEFASAVAEGFDLAVYRPPVDVPPPEMRIYWHKRHDRNPAHRWMREQILGETRALVSKLAAVDGAERHETAA
jgi:DNA-binding transcriptional LysR family regulator